MARAPIRRSKRSRQGSRPKAARLPQARHLTASQSAAPDAPEHDHHGIACSSSCATRQRCRRSAASLPMNFARCSARLLVVLILLLLASAGMYLLERDVQPDKFDSIPEAPWWALSTLTTVGYGDVVPNNAFEEGAGERGDAARHRHDGAASRHYRHGLQP